MGKRVAVYAGDADPAREQPLAMVSRVGSLLNRRLRRSGRDLPRALPLGY